VHETLFNDRVQGVSSDFKDDDARSAFDLLSTRQPSRLVMASHSSATVTLSEITIHCPCKAGIFTIPLRTPIDVACKRCTHGLSNHEDVSGVEGMAFLRSVIRVLKSC
jgi:hypothetical protein